VRRGGKAADVAGHGRSVLAAEAGDLVVVGGEPGQGQFPELLEVADGGVAVGELVPELVAGCLQPGDLGVARVGRVSAGAERREARFSNSSFRCR
jgi:hypothetical protein